MRVPRHLACILAGMLLLGSCQAGSNTEDETGNGSQGGDGQVDPIGGSASGTFRWAIQEPSSIVPPDATDPHALAVVDAVFDSLTVWDEDLRPAPAAAVSWTSDDLRTWTFDLRDDATFHDESATPVTAADFKFSWEEAVRTDNAGYHLRDVEGHDALRNGDAEGLEGVEAVNDLTLRVTLDGPNADFPSIVAHPALGPLHRELWAADEATYREQPVGNGPFRVSEAWARGQFIRLARFRSWTGGPPAALDEVVFQIMDRDTAYLAFQQGRLDFTELPAGALENAVGRYGESADGYSGPGVLTGNVPVVYYLGFQVTEPPFDDPDVRRGVSLAVDRAAVATENLEGNVSIIRSLANPAIPDAADTCDACVLDRDRAQATLREADISEMRLWFNRGGGHDRVAQQVRADLGDVGVRVAFQTEEFPDYLEVLRAGEAGFFRFGWTAEYPTLDDSLRPLLHSRSIPSPGSENAYNYGRFQNDAVDELLDQARATADPTERAELYLEAERIALDEQAVVPLFGYHHRAVVSERVSGFRMSAMGRADLTVVSVRPVGDS